MILFFRIDWKTYIDCILKIVDEFTLHNCDIINRNSIGRLYRCKLQQASAITDNWREEFRVLTDEFEDAVSNATDQEPPNHDSIQQLVDDYKTNLTKIFESSDNQTGML